MIELEIHEVFTNLQKGDSYYAGVFDSKDYPYKPAPPVRCNYFSAFMFTSGTGFLVADNFEYEVKTGRVFIFNDRQTIGWSYYENAVGLVVAFTPPVALSLGIQSVKPYVDLLTNERHFFRLIFENIIYQFNKRDALSKSIIHAGVGYLYALFNRYSEAPESYDLLITKLRNLVCNNFAKDFSVEMLAAELRVSAKELNERCLKKIGLTTKQYVLELKLTEAKRLLIYSELNTSQIAYQIGIEDPSYFARLFRKKAALTPSEFIKKYRI